MKIPILLPFLVSCTRNQSNSADSGFEPECPPADCFLQDADLAAQLIDLSAYPVEQCVFEHGERFLLEEAYDEAFTSIVARTFCFPEGVLEQSACVQAYAACDPKYQIDEGWWALTYLTDQLNTFVPSDTSALEYTHFRFAAKFSVFDDQICTYGAVYTYVPPFPEETAICNIGGHGGDLLPFIDACQDGTIEEVYANEVAACEESRL